VVREFARTAPEVRLIENPGNRGKGYSVRSGLLQALGEVVMFTDADLSAPMEEAERCLPPSPAARTSPSARDGWKRAARPIASRSTGSFSAAASTPSRAA
jgi:glycosyltransferase involved in cell wall biosynthesis